MSERHDAHATQGPSVNVLTTVPKHALLSVSLSEWWRALDGPVTQVVQELFRRSQTRLAVVVVFSILLAVVLIVRYFLVEGNLVLLLEDGTTPVVFVGCLMCFGAVILVLLETLQIKNVVDDGLCGSISRVELTTKVAVQALVLQPSHPDEDDVQAEMKSALEQLALIRTALESSPRVVPLVFGIHVRYELLISYAVTAAFTTLLPLLQQSAVMNKVE